MDNISSCFEAYYNKLYTQSELNNDDQAETLLAGLDLPTVTDGQNKSLKAAITSEELSRAISGLKTNKSPGPDGYTAEWYKVFKEPLTLLLLRAFNWVLQTGETCPPPPGEKQ